MKGTRFQKGLLAFCGILSLIAILVALSFFIPFFLRSGTSSAALSQIARSECRLPVTVTFFGRSSDTISARIAFYSADGDLAGTLERSWPGWELRLDCIVIGLKSGWLVFPYQVSTDATAEGRGVNLVRFYDDSGLPILYDSLRLTGDEQKALRQLFAIVRTEEWMPDFLGRLPHRSVTIRAFQEGIEYSLYITGRGTLEMRGN